MKSDKKVLKSFVLITQIGITMIVPIFLCLFVGMKLDEWFKTNFITIIGIILGILAAFRNVYVMTKQFYLKDKEKEDAQLRYIQELKNNKKSHK
ncbi:MAG: AtpZ/AtpI family protein [Clostridiales bacterium]|nr:AtpZ/AtpI family protein [Clostridiales bacterium]